MSISVVIPAFNSEKYIGEAIESALAQTRPADEILVADDASTDGTAALAEAYGAPVRVIRNSTNAGPGTRRNQAVAQARGELVAFLDADDRWTPQHLESLAGLLERFPEAGFAVAAVRVFGDGAREERPFPECDAAPANIFPQLMRMDGLWPTTAMVRRTAFEAAGGFSEIVEYSRGRRVQVEDYDFFLRLALRFSCVSSPAATALYRMHPEQASVLLDQQTLLAFKYRLRLVRGLENSSEGRQMLPIAVDRMQRAWEGHLREAWQKSNLTKVRAMVRWGRRQELLRLACDYYRWRMLCPRGAWRLIDGLRKRRG